MVVSSVGSSPRRGELDDGLGIVKFAIAAYLTISEKSWNRGAEVEELIAM